MTRVFSFSEFFKMSTALMSTFRNRYKLWPTLYVLYPYIILHACIQWRHNLHIRLHMQSLRYRPGSMNRIVSKHSNGYLYFYCSRAIIYTKTLKQIHLSVIIFKHFIYRDNWITQLPKTISNNQQVSWKENNDTDMILYTLRSLRQYLKAIERQANRVNQQGNLCLQYFAHKHEHLIYWPSYKNINSVYWMVLVQHTTTRNWSEHSQSSLKAKRK